MTSRATAYLSAKLERNLLAYATVASAGCVTVLAFPQQTQARVVYTPANIHFGIGDAYVLDLNNDGIGELVIWDSTFCSDYCDAYISVRRQKGSDGSVQLMSGTSRYFAAARKRSGQIGPKKEFGHDFVMMAGIGNHSSFGPWANVKGRYLGLRFTVNGERHYGWARMSVTVQRFEITATLTGYAYETKPNKPIVAGDKGTGDSLGDLALGASAKK
jgi:hypothetical protein